MSGSNLAAKLYLLEFANNVVEYMSVYFANSLVRAANAMGGYMQEIPENIAHFQGVFLHIDDGGLVVGNVSAR